MEIKPGYKPETRSIFTCRQRKLIHKFASHTVANGAPSMQIKTALISGWCEPGVTNNHQSACLLAFTYADIVQERTVPLNICWLAHEQKYNLFENTRDHKQEITQYDGAHTYCIACTDHVYSEQPLSGETLLHLK